MDDAATMDGGLVLIEWARAGDMAALEQLVAPLIEPASPGLANRAEIAAYADGRLVERRDSV